MLPNYNSQHPSAMALLAGADENCSSAISDTQFLIATMRETDRVQSLFLTSSISLLWLAEIPMTPSLSATRWRYPDVPPTASSSGVEQPVVLLWEEGKKKREKTQRMSVDLSSNSAFSSPDGRDPSHGGCGQAWTKLPQIGAKQAGQNRRN